jgi:hypothetical protein
MTDPAEIIKAIRLLANCGEGEVATAMCMAAAAHRKGHTFTRKEVRAVAREWAEGTMVTLGGFTNVIDGHLSIEVVDGTLAMSLTPKGVAWVESLGTKGGAGKAKEAKR